jgi:hypothetical protein
MKAQRLASLGSTIRYRLLPSLCRPGVLSVATLRAESLLIALRATERVVI